MKNVGIVSTVSVLTGGKAVLKELVKSGVSIFRFNFSHAQFDEVAGMLQEIKDINAELGTDVKTLLDTKGPELRTGTNAEPLQYTEGQVFEIVMTEEARKNPTDLVCLYDSLVADVNVGNVVVVDSGLFNAEVIEKKEDRLVVKALNTHKVKNKRHVNLPGVTLKLPGLSDKDVADVEFAIAQKMDYIAMSFVRYQKDVQDLKDLLAKHNADIKIISKIENHDGMNNLDEIISISDGIMVARGDLGTELPMIKIPAYQIEIVNKTTAAGKPVIVATQMMESMIENPIPTRAEINDIFTAVLQGTDYTMLSGETANGKYPVECVKLMKATIDEALKHLAK